MVGSCFNKKEEHGSFCSSLLLDGVLSRDYVAMAVWTAQRLSGARGPFRRNMDKRLRHKEGPGERSLLFISRLCPSGYCGTLAR